MIITILPASDNKSAIISVGRIFSLKRNTDAKNENKSENARLEIDKLVMEILRKSTILRREPLLEEIVHNTTQSKERTVNPGKTE